MLNSFGGNMKKGFLMVVSGPSGVGKGTICDILLRDNKDIKYSISSLISSEIFKMKGFLARFLNKKEKKLRYLRRKFDRYP